MFPAYLHTIVCVCTVATLAESVSTHKKLPELSLRELRLLSGFWDQAGTTWTFTVTGCTRFPLMPQMVIGTVLFTAYLLA